MLRYSIECLVSMIEIQQFQEFLMDHISEKVCIIKLPSDITRSFIFEKYQDELIKQDKNDIALDVAKLMAHELYLKYIKVGACLEINIAAKLRKQATDILGDKQRLKNINVTMSDLLHLFDEIRNEMRILLTYSHLRFKEKEEYKTVIQLFYQRCSISSTTNISMIMKNQS